MVQSVADAAPEQRQSAAKSIRMRRSRLTPANCRYLVIECVIVSFLWKINSELAGLPIGQRYLKGRFGAGVGEKHRPAVEHCGEIVVHRIDHRRPLGQRQSFIVNGRSEEHTSELQSLMRISYAVFCLKKKNKNRNQ